jgi:hypothetical protein
MGPPFFVWSRGGPRVRLQNICLLTVQVATMTGLES